ncbi:calcineurin-binding protein cabin-1-like isoform X2 [Dysidea avara]|uniref:calcineurin-binding protein cabin-1-like isoform X2 n=1 Tax=Dysidea avara TaxID=196820 RepID=UPI0033268EA6
MLLTPLNCDSGSNAVGTSASSKKTSKEAQESACFQEYHDALKLQRDGDLNGARALYLHLLQSSFLMGEESSGTVSATATKLKYSICRNLAGIFKDQGDLSVAIETYLKATRIDSTDLTTWLQLSKVAQLQGNLPIARMALEKALECNPDHWPCLDQLCRVLFSIQDYPACLATCSTALERNPSYEQGLVYVDHILRENGDTLWIRQFEGLKKYQASVSEVSSSGVAKCLEAANTLRQKWSQRYKDEEEALISSWEPIKFSKDLQDLTWLSLGRWLVAAWDHCDELARSGKSSWSCRLELPDKSNTVKSVTFKLASPLTQSSPSTSDTTLSSSAGDNIPHKSSPQKRKSADVADHIPPKRRSARAARGKRNEGPQNYFDMLKKYIPERFGMAQLESLHSLELSPLRKKSAARDSIGKHLVAALASPTRILANDSQPDNVQQFIAEQKNNSGIVFVVYDFLKHLALHFNWVWPFPLAGIFVDLYQRVEQRVPQPPALCNQLEKAELDYLKDFVRISLVYCELLVDSQCRASTVKKKGTDKTSPTLPLVDGLISLMLFSVSKFEGQEKDHVLFRVVWLMAQVKMTRNNPSATTGHVLELCRLLENYADQASVIIYLCNLHHDPYISLAHAKERVNSLERSLSYENINLLYQKGSYSEVVDHLLPVLEQESGSYNEFLIGSSQLGGDQKLQLVSSLYLLLSSLFKLNRIEECLCCTVQAMDELLTHNNTNSELWTNSLFNTFDTVNKCIVAEPHLLAKPSQQGVVKVLIVQICRVLDLLSEIADSPLLHTLPVCLPWKIFYYILKGEETDDNENNEGDKEDTPAIAAVTEPSSSDVTNTPTCSVKKEPSDDPQTPVATRSISDLTSPMHDHTYALPSVLITPTMMATIDSHSQSHKGYTYLSKVGSILTTPLLPAEKSSLKKSVEFLKEAHDHLGTLGWCSWDNGCLLSTSIQVLRKELRVLTAFSPQHREVLLQELEQCYYCLYGHPRKVSKAKARGLVEHGANPITLTWEDSLVLMEYFHPASLPSVEDHKTSCMTTDLLALYKRIVETVPGKLGQVMDQESIQAFIDGNSTELPQPKLPHTQSAVISELYYLLADESLRTNDINKALKYYLFDLSYCPERFDSWAGIALAKSRKIIDKIQQCDIKLGVEKFVQRHAASVLRCFEKAVSLNDKNCFVIEKKTLYPAEELQSWAKECRNKGLYLSKTCFTMALGLTGTKLAQPWLYQYMLSKTYYKLDMPINVCLEGIVTTTQMLDREGAVYPRNVDLSSKFFAKESIEVCYQLYSMLLKHMIKGNSGDDSSQMLAGMKECPLSAVIFPEAVTFANKIIPDHTSTTSCESVDEVVTNASMMTPVEEDSTIVCMDTAVCCQEEHTSTVHSTAMDTTPPQHAQDNLTQSTSSDVTPDGSLGEMMLETLNIPSHMDTSTVYRCICVLLSLLFRFPVNFKPLYRLAWLFYKLKAYQLAKMCLLGPLPKELQQAKILPLFVLKSNIFTNLWQIPGEEINRPGSFPSHARTNLELLVNVLLDLHDLSSLTTLASNLRNKPDPHKQYLRDTERLAITKRVVLLCVELLKKFSTEVHAGEADTSDLFAKGSLVKQLASKTDVGSKELSKEVASILSELMPKLS